MIHLTTTDREVAVDFADQLCRKGGLDVAVYTSPGVDGYQILDEVGFHHELSKYGMLRTAYSPERRAFERVSFRTLVQGRVLKRVANA